MHIANTQSKFFNEDWLGLRFDWRFTNDKENSIFVSSEHQKEPGGRGKISQAVLFLKTVRMVKTYTLPPPLYSWGYGWVLWTGEEEGYLDWFSLSHQKWNFLCCILLSYFMQLN